MGNKTFVITGLNKVRAALEEIKAELRSEKPPAWFKKLIEEELIRLAQRDVAEQNEIWRLAAVWPLPPTAVEEHVRCLAADSGLPVGEVARELREVCSLGGDAPRTAAELRGHLLIRQALDTETA